MWHKGLGQPSGSADTSPMAGNLDRILSLEVPIIVQLGQRLMPMRDVISLIPGAIIELPKGANEELELLVNNRVVGVGTAVKVGENFGLKIAHIGDAKDRVKALGRVPSPTTAVTAEAGASADDQALADLAAQMLAGQS